MQAWADYLDALRGKGGAIGAAAAGMNWGLKRSGLEITTRIPRANRTTTMIETEIRHVTEAGTKSI